MNTRLVFLILVMMGATLASPRLYCTRGDETCWPSAGDVATLYETLNPTLPRVLSWPGGTAPRVSAVPIYSPGDQPLYGLGVGGLAPVYTQSASDRTGTCFLPPSQPFAPTFCLTSVRNSPLEGWTPAFVAWPLSASHVQAVVNFATKHNLCISVAGTGHDFLNRHTSCDAGMLIRTSLMKNISWDLHDSRRLGAPDGSVRLGPGLVFHEVQSSAAQRGRFVSSGWALTVGVVGWSLGGGHGPLAPGAGLGVDNILEVELVTANGSIVIANAGQNPDLFWALRGGGGSNWGVVTAITLAAHRIPAGGFAKATAYFQGPNCDAGATALAAFIDGTTAWMHHLDSRFGGLVFVAPAKNDSSACPVNWTVIVKFAYLGSSTDPVFVANVTNVPAFMQPYQVFPVQVKGYPTWFAAMADSPLEPIIPVPFFAPSAGSSGGVPSVLIQRPDMVNGNLSAIIKAQIASCVTESFCSRMDLYHDITGNVGSSQPPNVAISSGFRTAAIHFVYGPGSAANVAQLERLGPNSYFSESAYEMTGTAWQARYWGDNYPRLLSIKQRWDPTLVFTCHNCVGSV